MADAPLISRNWTCQLCQQRKNTDDMDKCKTCARPRGHNPIDYRRRIKEIREMDPSQGWYDDYSGGSWSDWWGLIVGLLILAGIVGLILWAMWHDSHTDEVRDITEL
mmetsp:Transcript_52352/g.114920  ORF Transcript_52352/g.114920 Transcript_52352/m.114920 type:complete len:107 (-) Transcript_52352:81-401(-)